MSLSKLFDVKHQLTFYGAYHSNKWNVLIHVTCVPLILWSAQVFLSAAPTPSWFPNYTHIFNEYASFEWTWATILAIIYQAYYFALEPVAATIYLPQMVAMLLTATSYAHRDHGQRNALYLHICSWIMQFIGHGVAEGRSPALLDNIVGAVALAPFFVHLEVLFFLGYRKKFHKELINSIGVEIAKFRKVQGDKTRADKKDL